MEMAHDGDAAPAGAADASVRGWRCRDRRAAAADRHRRARRARRQHVRRRRRLAVGRHRRRPRVDVRPRRRHRLVRRRRRPSSPTATVRSPTRSAPRSGSTPSTTATPQRPTPTSPSRPSRRRPGDDGTAIVRIGVTSRQTRPTTLGRRRTSRSSSTRPARWTSASASASCSRRSPCSCAACDPTTRSPSSRTATSARPLLAPTPVAEWPRIVDAIDALAPERQHEHGGRAAARLRGGPASLRPRRR